MLVLVADAAGARALRLPARIEGHAVEVQVTGALQAREDADD